MTLRYSVLASGSTGNSLYIETDKRKFLVDAGLSGKKMTELLEQIGRHPKDLDAIFITHEHADHIKGVGILARKFALPVYANAKTWKEMDNLVGDIPAEQKFHIERGEVKTFGDVDIETFGVSHDAAEPMFYIFHYEGKKLVIATDMGYVSERIKRTIKNADVYIFEANHDLNMLRMGPYPWNIKRRILSDVGHVSNEDAGYALADCIGEKTKKIYLAHLSQENNMKDLARMTVEQILKEKGFSVGEQFCLYDTDPYIPTGLVNL